MAVPHPSTNRACRIRVRKIRGRKVASMANQAGDRPNVISLERLDLKDLLRIIAAPFEDRYLVDGGLMGACEGVMSAAGATFEDVDVGTKRLTFGEMILAGYKNVAGAANEEGVGDRAKGMLVHFIPTSPKQLQTSVNIIGYSGSAGVVWWRPDLVETDLENRRRWEAGFPDGRAIAMRTMLRSRVFFSLTASFATPPGDGETWYRLCRFDYTDAPTAPTVQFCHAFDQGWEATGAGVGTSLHWLGQLMMAQHDVGDNDGRSYGIARALALLTNIILRIKSKTHTFDPITGVITSSSATLVAVDHPRGLLELDNDLAAAETTIDALQVQCVLLAGLVDWNGSTYGFTDVQAQSGISYSVTQSNFASAQRAILTIANLPVGWVITGAQVEAAITAPLNEAWMPYSHLVGYNQPMPFTGDGATDLQIEIVTFEADGDGGFAIDQDFVITLLGRKT